MAKPDLRPVIVDAAAALVRERGLTAIAMAHVAERAGITRATLYKYFPDVRAILNAWHARQVAANLDALTAARDHASAPAERLAHMLETYALMVYHQHSPELLALLHSSEHSERGYAQFARMLRDVITEGARAGSFRRDVPAAELASFCTHALGAASGVGSVAAARRLARLAVAVVTRS